VPRTLKQTILTLTMLTACALPATAQAGGGTVIFNGGGCYIVQVDPVKSWGVDPSAHKHCVFGQQGLTANSTGTTIRASAPVAASMPKSVKTIWWMPALISKLGQDVPATTSNQYYSNGCNPADPAKPCPPPLDVRPPNDLAYIIGSSDNTDPNKAVGLWRCLGSPTTTQKRYIPTNCDAYGNRGVQMAVYGPTCWDGVNVGPGLGRTGTGPASGSGHVASCDSAHPVRIMGAVWGATFPAAAIGARLSSDPTFAVAGLSLHIDHVDEGVPNSQGKDGLAQIRDMCMNYDRTATANAVTCTVSGTGIVKRASDSAFVTD
jgi:hypothetical protein